MVAIVIAFRLIDRGLEELDVLGRFVVDQFLQLFRDLGIAPGLGDRLALNLKLPEHSVDLAVRALLERN